MHRRAVITIATTKPLYIEMALTLARSFQRWNEGSGIAFHLVTDLDFPLPADLTGVHVLRVPEGELGAGFSPKLHLDSLAPGAQTLFIDADCLCMGPLDPVFARFAGRAVAVVGTTISTGLWWGDVDALCARFGVKALPHFNGGIYYLEPGPEASAVFTRARELEQQYDGLGILRLRGRPNDEIIMAIAMAEAGLWPVPDDGTIMGVFNRYPKFEELSVFAGRCRMSNPPASHPLHHKDLPLGEAAPVIPHFVNNYTDHWRYRAEAMKLRYTSEKGWPDLLASAAAGLTIELPGAVVETTKNTLRPTYHRLFGARRMTPSKRV